MVDRSRRFAWELKLWDWVERFCTRMERTDRKVLKRCTNVSNFFPSCYSAPSTLSPAANLILIWGHVSLSPEIVLYNEVVVAMAQLGAHTVADLVPEMVRPRGWLPGQK